MGAALGTGHQVHASPIGAVAGKPTAAAVAVVTIALALPAGGYGAQAQAAAALLAWWSIVVALFLGLAPRGPVPRSAVAGGCALLGLAGITAASAAWSGDAGRSVADAIRVLAYAGGLALVVLAAAPGSARAWLAGLALGLLGIAGLALGSRMLPALYPEPALARVLPAEIARLSHPLGYWNGLGAAMAAGALLLLWFGAAARRRAARAAATAAAALPLLALYLTSSRGAVLAFAAGLAVLLALGPQRLSLGVTTGVALAATAVLAVVAGGFDTVVDGARTTDAGGQGLRMLLVTAVMVAAAWAIRSALDAPVARAAPGRAARKAAAVIAVAVAAAGVWALDPVERIDGFTAPPAAVEDRTGFVARHLISTEGNGRAQFWDAALDAFAGRPLAGVGAGGFEAFWAREGSLAYFVRDAHSLLFETAAELGLAGLLLLAVLTASAVLAARARYRTSPDRAAVAAAAGLLACGATSAAVDWTWELPAAFLPALLAVGLLVGPALCTSARSTPPRRRRWAPVLAVGVAATLAGGLALAAESRLAASRDAAARDDLAAAAGAARDAAVLLPWSAEPHAQLAVVEEARGDPAAAAAAMRAALERAPVDWRLWVVAARVHSRLGDAGAARRAIRRARRLSPCAPLFLTERATASCPS